MRRTIVFGAVLALFGQIFSPLRVRAVSSAPLPADVRFCAPSDFRIGDIDHADDDRLSAAETRALYAGPPRTVRLVYFLPSDRAYRSEVVDQLKTAMVEIRSFFGEQMQMHGYGNDTFELETDASGEPVVHRVDGKFTDEHYLGNVVSSVLDEVDQVFDRQRNIYVVVIDISSSAVDGALGKGSRRSKVGGAVYVSGQFRREVVAHELGHAFGLQHDFRSGSYIMSYGPGLDQLSACSAEFLAVHPYFNSSVDAQRGSMPNVEFTSHWGFRSGSKSTSVRLKVGDPEGIHQVILLARPSRPSFFAPSGYEVKTCRGYSGETSAVVEFNYDGLVPSEEANLSSEDASLSDSNEHELLAVVVDVNGNLNNEGFVLRKIGEHYIGSFEGHADGVGSIAYSPDGSMLASGSFDRTVKLWDVSSRRVFATLPAHGDRVISVAFSPNGSILASGSLDRTVKLWDVSSRRVIATLKDHREGLTAVAFSPTQPKVASASWDGLVGLWDVPSGGNVSFLRHGESVLSIAFSPDGRILAAGTIGGPIYVWDVVKRQALNTLEGHTNWVRSLVFLNDGKTLLSAASDNTIRMWDIKTGSNIVTRWGGVETMTLSPDGATLAFGSIDFGPGPTDYSINIWDIASERSLATVEWHASRVLSVAFSPDGKTLASGSFDNTVGLWDATEWTGPRPHSATIVSGDNQQGKPGSELSGPLVVEVKDQNADPMPGVEVTFTVIRGEGRLTQRFTAVDVTTDEDGRADLRLTLGSDPGTNTVDVSIDGRELARFTAVGVGTQIIRRVDGGHRGWHLPSDAIARLGNGRIGTSDRAVAFSPNGQLVAVTSGIGAWLYDALTFRATALLSTKDPVESLAFSPNGMTLASGLWNGQVKLWNVETGDSIATHPGHGSVVKSVVFSSDGKILVSGSLDRTVKLWDVRTDRVISVLTVETYGADSVALSPDATWLAVGSLDGTIQLFDVVTSEIIWSQRRHANSVGSLRFSPDGTMLVSGSWDRTIKLWEAASGEELATYKEHTDGVLSVDLSRDGMVLASGSWDGSIRLWEVSTGESISVFQPHAFGVESLSFSPEGTILASGSTDGTIKLLDVGTGHTVSLLQEHSGPVNSLAVSPDATVLATGLWEKEIKLWRLSTGEHEGTIDGHESYVLSVAFSPDGRMLASGSSDRSVGLWDVATGNRIASFPAHVEGVSSVAFSPDGSRLASGSSDRSIKLWDVAAGAHVFNLDGHSGPVSSVVFSPDGTMLASGSRDRKVKLWDTTTGNLIDTLNHAEYVPSVAFSGDGAMLASGSFDGMVRLWDIASRSRIALFEGHSFSVVSLAFSPDGTILASGSVDRRVILWDVSTGDILTMLEGHTGPVESVAFARGGAVLISGSADGTVTLWDLWSRHVRRLDEDLGGLEDEDQGDRQPEVSPDALRTLDEGLQKRAGP